MADDVLRAVEALCRPELVHIVDLVAYAEDGPGTGAPVVVANHAGAVRLAEGHPPERLYGDNPIGSTDPLARTSWAEQVADPWPPSSRDAYPLAAERLASFFADERAPDVAVIHTGSHYFPEQGGHAGEHGSLTGTQSRAVLMLAGAGVRSAGVVDSWARTIDVAPTLSWLAGVDAETLSDVDGRVLSDHVGRGAKHVVGLLWDGGASDWLLHLVAEGMLPNASRLLERGLALRGGAIAEFPSVTLCNHTSALTGVGPGRHGVIGNVYFDRAAGERVVPNDPSTWHRSAEWLRPGVRTVFERIAEVRPSAVTASVDEPIDRGATHSTMALIRTASAASAGSGVTGASLFDSFLPDPRLSSYASQSYVSDPDFAWGTQVDDTGLVQVLRLWEDVREAPAFTWWNSTLTDSAMHAGGPGSEIARAGFVDTDRRLGVFLDHLEAQGVLDETVFLLTADHGFETSDPSCRGGWDGGLKDAGLTFRDEGAGFIYLGES